MTKDDPLYMLMIVAIAVIFIGTVLSILGMH